MKYLLSLLIEPNLVYEHKNTMTFLSFRDIRFNQAESDYHIQTLKDRKSPWKKSHQSISIRSYLSHNLVPYTQIATFDWMYQYPLFNVFHLFEKSTIFSCHHLTENP